MRVVALLCLLSGNLAMGGTIHLLARAEDNHAGPDVAYGSSRRTRIGAGGR